MRWYQLEADWEVVAEVGHSDRVTCLHVDVDRGVVCSGGDDGFVFVRSIATGQSVLPPLHTTAVRALVALPDAPQRLLVVVRDALFGLDLDGGGFVALDGLDPTAPADGGAGDGRAAVATTDAVVVGAADGTIWRLTVAGGARRLAQLEAAVVALASGGPHGDTVVAATAAGAVVALDAHTGAIAWRAAHAPGEVLALAASTTAVAIGGAGPAVRSGRVTVRSLADGGVAHVADHPHPVEAVATVDGRFVVRDGDAEPAEGAAAVSTLTVDTSGTCWWGTDHGEIACTDGRALPSRSSGVIAVALREDEDELATVDGRVLVRWSPRSGERIAAFDAPLAVAVGYAGADPVIGFADGRLARADGASGAVRCEATTSCGRLQAIGSFGGLVVAVGTEGVDVFHEETLEPATGPATLPAGFADGIGVVGRDGTWFESHGIVAGWRLLFVAGDYVAAVRPGVFGATESATSSGLVRVWDGDRFLDATPVTAG